MRGSFPQVSVVFSVEMSGNKEPEQSGIGGMVPDHSQLTKFSVLFRSGKLSRD
jgi:hypothetical protein